MSSSAVFWNDWKIRIVCISTLRLFQGQYGGIYSPDESWRADDVVIGGEVQGSG